MAAKKTIIISKNEYMKRLRGDIMIMNVCRGDDGWGDQKERMKRLWWRWTSRQNPQRCWQSPKKPSLISVLNRSSQAQKKLYTQRVRDQEQQEFSCFHGKIIFKGYLANCWMRMSAADYDRAASKRRQRQKICGTVGYGLYKCQKH